MATIGNVTTTTATGGSAPQDAAARNALDKDTFLKLMVAQLQHQDPMNPTEGNEWMAQMAQFSSVEQLTNLAKSNDRDQAVGLIGHEVTYVNDARELVLGKVERVDLSGAVPTMTVGDASGIKLTSISDVR